MLEFLFGRRYRHIERQMIILGNRLEIPAKLPASRNNPFSKYYPKIEGILMDRKFSLELYQQGSGKNKRYYTELNFELENKYEYTLTLYKERIWSKLGKLVGMQDIEIGDAPFDKSFIIKSNDDYFATEVLKNQKSKDYFRMILNSMDGSFILDGNNLNYKQLGLIRSDQDRVFVEHLIETGLVLCMSMEKFAFDRDPTRM